MVGRFIVIKGRNKLFISNLNKDFIVKGHVENNIILKVIIHYDMMD